MKKNGTLLGVMLMALIIVLLMVVMSRSLEMQAEAAEDDRYVLAHLLAGECQDGTWDMQIAVGSVALNRVKSKHYPNTLIDVVREREWNRKKQRWEVQYACYWDGNYNRKPTKRNWAAADYLLEHGSQFPAGVLYQSQVKLGPIYTKIGNQYFCYEK